MTNALEDEPLPVYGEGLQLRDRLYVEDNCRALLLLLERGEKGEAYNIQADNHRPNIEVARTVLDMLDKPYSLIQFVEDRAGHDPCYYMDWTKLRALGWEPQYDFDARDGGDRALVRRQPRRGGSASSPATSASTTSGSTVTRLATARARTPGSSARDTLTLDEDPHHRRRTDSSGAASPRALAAHEVVAPCHTPSSTSRAWARASRSLGACIGRTPSSTARR